MIIVFGKDVNLHILQINIRKCFLTDLTIGSDSKGLTVFLCA